MDEKKSTLPALRNQDLKKYKVETKKINNIINIFEWTTSPN